MYAWRYLPVVSSLLAESNAATSAFCKRDPSSPQWPSQEQWQALNTSVSGALRVPSAPAVVCHPDQPEFNNATCGALTANWTSTDWVAQNPWVVDYNDDTCLPNPNAPCSTAGYPAYVVEADSAEDVAAGLKFAKDNQIRLIVKGTGHDYPGRSSGPGSLSIWTHKLRGIQILISYPKAIQYGGVSAIKISAGMRMGEIYQEVAKNNLTIVGGADLGVGIGGWITAAGHSPISAKYGLGADQVLEMDVVTANGDILTIDENNHEDLFWAMRGGGGSTFAVLLSVTIKAYPSIPITAYVFSYNTTSDSDTFWSAVAHFHADLPRIANSGGMGYYFVYPFDNSTGNAQGFIAGEWLFPQRSLDQAQAIISPFEKMLNSSPSWAKDRISVQNSPVSYPDFTTMWLNNPRGPGGSHGRLGSYLFNEQALTSDIPRATTQLRRASTGGWPLLGHLVSGPGVHQATIPGGSSAILPAWRKAYSHVIAPRTWMPLNLTSKNEVTRSLRSEAVPSLKSIGPDSGAYINEADPTNPDWKTDYFGANYDRLLDIKHKWDPEGVFWCRPCVGHDEWDVVDGPAEEDQENWAIAQVGGKICKKQTYEM